MASPSVAQLPLIENFRKDHQLSADLHWLFPPTQAPVLNNSLIFAPDKKTDYWCRTHYGFIFHNGHFLHANLNSANDFIMTTHVTFHAKHQYDQAGLFIRYSEDCWLKTSIEFESPKEHSRLGAVVTNHGYSDWSTQNVPNTTTDFYFCIVKEGKDFIVKGKAHANAEWEQLRMAHLFEDKPVVQVGLYACSPIESGFEVRFHELNIQPHTKK